MDVLSPHLQKRRFRAYEWPILSGCDFVRLERLLDLLEAS